MQIRKLLLALALFAGVAAMAAAQGQSLVLEFVDGDNLDVVYPDATSFSFASGSIMEGDSIPVGATVKTGAGTSAELRISPNGTIIKLAKNTTFKVEALATSSQPTNGFTLAAGKIRAVAAVGSQYNVYTTNTVAGVRGTDFGMAFEEGKKALLLVKKGKVEYGTRGPGDTIAEPIMVAAGQFADFFKSMAPAPFTEEQLAEEYEGMDIDPARMPEQAADEEPAEQPAEDTATGPSDSLATGVAIAEEPAPAEDVPEEAPREQSELEKAIMEWLGEVMGLEIGSITINGETWAKAVIQPTFNLGKLKMGLFLPVIYSENLFDPTTWYRPAGNDEWSFGTDIGFTADTWMEASLDAVKDLALKFKFVEYGQPLEDKFFLKIGNLDSFTVGHGLIMRNYANDTDFPSIRHIGLNLGLDFEGWGFEALTNDLTDNQIVGGRLFIRPVAGTKIAFGLSGVADLNPASVFNTLASPDAADAYGDPIFIGTGLDLDLPIIQSDLLGIRLFADGAAMVPWVRNEYTYDGHTGAAGFRYDMVWTGESIKNWGASSGIIGNVLFIDWRLEYRYFTGAFTPSFFDAGYERRRSDIVREYAAYLSGASSIDQSPSVMGIYGEGGATILKDKLSFELGYFWPWSAEAASLDDQLAVADDYFKASLAVKKGLIPVIDVEGSISYERRGLASAIASGSLDSLFDENTTFSGEISFPVPKAPSLNLAFVFATAVARDATTGDVDFDADGNPVIVPTITMETRLSF